MITQPPMSGLVVAAGGGSVPALTANRAVVSDSGGSLSTSSVTAAEIGYVAGAASNLQTQITNITPVSFAPSTMTVDIGTLNAGTAADLAAVGGTDVSIQEVASTGLQVQLDATGVTRLSTFVFYGQYSGGASHDIVVEFWNWGASAWEQVGVFSTTTAKQWYSFALNNAGAYIQSTNSRMRFRHVGSGIPSHYLLLDKVAFAYGAVAGVGSVGASSVAFIPSGDIAATNTQAAIQEVADERVPYTGANWDVDLGSKNLTTTGTGTLGSINVPGAAVAAVPAVTGLTLSLGTSTALGYRLGTFYCAVYAFKVINGIKVFSSAVNASIVPGSGVPGKAIIISWTDVAAGTADGYRVYAVKNSSSSAAINYVETNYGTPTFTANSPVVFNNIALDFPYVLPQTADNLITTVYSGASTLNTNIPAIYSSGLKIAANATVSGTLATIGESNFYSKATFWGAIFLGGSQALYQDSSGNTAILNQVASFDTAVSLSKQNIVIGRGAGGTSVFTGTNNVLIGELAGSANSSQSGCVAIGYACAQQACPGPFIAIGSYALPTAANQAIFGGAYSPINDVYFGYGVTYPSPNSVTINPCGGSGTNISGGKLTLAGGKSTGSAVPGVVSLATSSTIAGGTTLQTLTDRVVVSEANTQFLNGVRMNRVAVTSNYSVLPSDYIVHCTSGSFTVTLPATSIAGQIYVIKNSGSGTVTVSTTDQGAVSLAPGVAVEVFGDGSSWQVF